MQTGGFLDGKKHGVWARYNKTGELMDRGSYDRGKRVGVWEYFDDKGSLRDTKDFG